MARERKKIFVITGGTGGIGFHSALGIASADVQQHVVILTGRNAERGETAVENLRTESGNPNIFVAVGDTLEQSPEGLETHFAVNVFAPYRLTKQLLPLFNETTARVVNVTGGPETPQPIDADNLQAEKGFTGLMTYGHSKSILEGMTMALSKELEAKGITVNCVFPGQAATAMTGSLDMEHLPGLFQAHVSAHEVCHVSRRWRQGSQKGIPIHRVRRHVASTTRRHGQVLRQQNNRALHATAHDPEVQKRIMDLIASTM